MFASRLVKGSPIEGAWGTLRPVTLRRRPTTSPGVLSYRAFAFGVVLIGALLGAPSALAQESDDENEPSDADIRARELYRLGDDLYSHGRYEEALAAFEESYELSGRPLLLFNMANAQERSGQWDAAIESLEGYLPHTTDEERPRIENRLRSLRQRASRLATMTGAEEGDESPPEPRRSLTGPLLMAGGGALLGGGLALALVANAARSDLDESCVPLDGRRVCPRSAESAQTRDRRASIAADALLIGGAAVLTVGLILFIRAAGERDEPEPEQQVDAQLGPGHVQAVYTRAF